MRQIRIGASNHLAVRPLIFGLARNTDAHAELIFDEPSCLATALERRDLDAALIPSIEFLRGVGEYSVSGPGLVAKGRTTSLVLVADRPLSEVRRIAVDEFSRTPLVVVRVALHKLHGILPDLCVLKRGPLGESDWKEDYDGVLLTDDEGLHYCARGIQQGESCHDIGEMWYSVHSRPLVLSLWAYNDESLGSRLEELLVASRDYGVENLPRLADTVARTSPYDLEFLFRHLSTAWGFHLGPSEEEGLRVLENRAYEYQLLQNRRLDRVLIGSR